MGLGINAANNPDFKQYELATFTNIEFIEPITDEQTLTNFKNEFGRWIVGNGLCELIETFSVFLDEIHLVCLYIAANSNQIPIDELKKRSSKYRRLNFINKLERLNNDFGIVLVQHPDCFLSINQARNCLTHRRGVVGNEDCFQAKELAVRWKGIDIIAETPSGEKISLIPIPAGVVLHEGTKIIQTFSERTKLFPIRSLVTFSPRELAEICLFTLLETNEVIRSIEVHAKKSGIPVTTQEPTQHEST